MAYSNPLDEYRLGGSPQQQALYGREANDQTLSEFVGTTNPVEYLTGNLSVGAQNQGATNALVQKFGDYSTQKYNTAKAQFAAKGINLDTYLDPMYQLYSAGDGASSNMGAFLEKTHILSKAQQNAIAMATSGQAAPDYKSKLMTLLGQAKANQQVAFRDPNSAAAVQRVQNLIDGLPTNQGVNPAVLASENAASARVAAPLAHEGGPIGAVMNGGAINNNEIGNGTNYDQLMKNAQAGIPNTVNGGTLPANGGGAATAGNITLDPVHAGSYIFGGRSYGTLGAAQAAATRTGVAPVYNPPAPTAPRGITPSSMPQRSTWAAGPAGDYQYKQAVDRFNAGQNGTQWTSPTNLAQVQSPDQATDYVNKLQDAIFQEQNSTTGGPPGTNETVDPLSLLQSYIGGKTPSGTSVIPTTGNGPAALDTQGELAKLRAQQGLDPLEQDLAGIDAQIQKIQGTQFNNQQAEEAKPVALGVMGGRISEEQRQANEALTPLLAQKTLLQQQITSKYNVVNTMMDAYKTDYTAASQKYNDDFNKTVQLTTLLRGISNDQITATEKARDDARANVTIVTNAIANGSLTWDKIDPGTKTQYTQLELQAGLPTGTIQAFSQKAGGGQWAMSTVLPGVDASGNQIATVIEQNKTTGEYRTTKLTTDYAPKPTAGGTQKGTYVDDKGNQVAWSIGTDGKVQNTVIGKSNVNLNSPDAKDQNEFDKFRAGLILKMHTIPPGYASPQLTYEQAASSLKGLYPTLSDDAIKYYLTGSN